jgi:hypothetical protein
MEDVLELYQEPYDPAYPLVCFDESPFQLVSEVRRPVPAEPGRPARIDYEYKREGTCNLFLLFEPGRGWRHVDVTLQRTALDFAQQMRELVDVHYPKAALITVVLDNLNTHTPAALYEAFPAAEARRILYRLEFRYTPKHGSWLNMAEVEFAVIRRQCLDQRIATIATVRRKVAGWQARRNAAKATVQWRFTTAKAREKLQRLYPSQT